MGNHTSFPSEETFESASTSSPDVNEQDSSQLDSNVSQVFSSNMSIPILEHQSKTKPIPTQSPNDHYSLAEANSLNHSSLMDKVENSIGLLEDHILFDATESMSVLDSSFGSSHSSIINISEQSSVSIPYANEQSNLFSEALLVDCVDKVQVLLKGITFEHGRSLTISDKTLNSLNGLYQAIGEFTSNPQCSQNEGSNINQMMSDCAITTNSTLACAQGEECNRPIDLTMKQICESRKESKSICQDTADSSQGFSINCIPQEQRLRILNDTFDSCSKCETVHTAKSTYCVAVVSCRPTSANGNNIPVDNSSSTTEDHIQITHENDPLTSKDSEHECMFVAEKLSVEPLLLKSLAALQSTTGVGLLTNVQNCVTSSCIPTITGLQQIMPVVNRPSMCCIQEKSCSTNVAIIPEIGSKDTLSLAKQPLGLLDIINDDKSAATLGKAVIRNALVFEKYALLFKRALNDDIVAASIGKALCRNALLIDNFITVNGVNKESQCQDHQQVVNTTVDLLSGNIQDQVFISNQLLSDKNKENEKPAREQLFKQTASKRKLGALEEETRRTKCFVLSQKSTAAFDKQTSNNAHIGDHLVKPVRKAKHIYTINDSASNTAISIIEKAKKKETLREIIMNGPRNEAANQQEQLMKIGGDTLKHTEKKKERWTVFEMNTGDMLELEDSEDEHVGYLLEQPLSSRIDLHKLESSQPETKDAECDHTDTLMGKIRCRSEQLDSLTGIYYFANKYIFCSICNANIFNHLRILDHINGNVHKTNMLNHKKTAVKFISTKAMLQSVWEQIDVSLGRKLFCKLVKFENDILPCTLCHVQISGSLNVIAHVLANEHKLALLDTIYAAKTVQNISKEGALTNVIQRKVSWSDGSFSSSDISLSECEGSIVEWLPTSTPTRSTTVGSDLSGIYYFARNYVFCSICNVNMFNSSIVLGHVHSKSHQANTVLQEQIESNQSKISIFNNDNKIQQIWNKIECTLGGTLFHTVLCIDKNDNFFCDLCNMQIIIPGHLNILDHVCGKKHNKEFLKRVKLPSCK